MPATFVDLPLVVAAGFGALHALIPCGHGWPVLVPLAAKRASAFGPGAAFAIGVTLGSTLIGALAGAFGQAILKDLRWTETVLGVAMIGFGIFYVASPRWVHAGHVHGGCQPHDEHDVEPHCGHGGHGPARGFADPKSPLVGAFLLGVLNMAVPCYSNATGLALALETKSAHEGGFLLGVFGLAAGITTIVLLAAVRRGLGLLGRLATERFERRVFVVSGIAMIVFGVMTVLHIGHDH